MGPKDKAAIVGDVIGQLEGRLAVLLGAAEETRAGANDDENRQEGKYDTRAIEAGYLAQGQSTRAAELLEALEAVRAMEVRSFARGEPAAVGALVEVEFPGESSRFLLVPDGGGIEVDTGAGSGAAVTTLAPGSPLGSALVGATAGDRIDLPGRPGGLRVLSVS